jgi:hypothetical protein
VRRVWYTGILNVSYLFSIASVPGDSLSLYCAAFALVMVNSTLSLANGST